MSSDIQRFRASSLIAGGTLSSFSASSSSYAHHASSMSASSSQRDESYHLLLELCAQEPTMQSCFKIIESTCLARGVDIEIGGKAPSSDFRMFLARHYLPFAESAIRYFFALGFVPWRLRRISTGDMVPEVIPFGIFTWSIESITNRTARRGMCNKNGMNAVAAVKSKITKEAKDMYQLAAERAFQKQKEHFSDPKRVPYPLQGDFTRMQTRRDCTKVGKDERLKGFADDIRNSRGAENASGDVAASKKKPRSQHHDSSASEDDDSDNRGGSGGGKKKRLHSDNNTPAYYRQQASLQRQALPPDDDESKILRYCISFTENCNVLEDDVEIYEYMAPTNSITRLSVLYGTVPTPMAHLLIDYRNIRTTQIRQAYADSYNTQVRTWHVILPPFSLIMTLSFFIEQAKLICSYSAAKNMYNISEGNPITNGDGWGPQQRLGINTDTNLPSEIEANAYTRDAVAENVMGSKPVEHKPVIYTLPKNTTIESQQKLESIIDVPQLQVCVLMLLVCVYERV